MLFALWMRPKVQLLRPRWISTAVLTACLNRAATLASAVALVAPPICQLALLPTVSLVTAELAQNVSTALGVPKLVTSRSFAPLEPGSVVRPTPNFAARSSAAAGIAVAIASTSVVQSGAKWCRRFIGQTPPARVCLSTTGGRRGAGWPRPRR
jgi:hypothetical protein